MASVATTAMPAALPTRSPLSAFELMIACNPPVFESLLNQIPTESILRLYHTSFFLQQFLQNSPTSWRYISWRLSQPAASTATVTNNGTGTGPRQSSNYALDQLLIYVINPFSTRLVSLELDNTAVSGGTLTQTVLVLRRDTLQHVSVRGCKNVSLKYHINPWLQIHALAQERSGGTGPPGYENLALKSLYTYRCRHHRRRPYLPSSLVRKESDSEPTHELVKTCHKLGIWTDTAWCTTPGARCYRRRGYVTMRVPQDPREVWVVYDRLWRSRNWLGPTEQRRTGSGEVSSRKRKRDCRSWEFEEEAVNGEAIGVHGEGKSVPAHLRQSHRQFVENVNCQNCSATILERCEQCSVMMHCSGCRKTLCASCAFDRPYLRNKVAPEEERNNFWWAPGCAVSPCSMQDQDAPQAPGAGGQNGAAAGLPTIKFKWCCTEPVFSGGGGITFGNGSNRDTDRIRAAPLPSGQGWEDVEFHAHHHHVEGLDDGHSLDEFTCLQSPIPDSTGRWSSLEALLQPAGSAADDGHTPASVPRILCDECYSSDQWKLKCKACGIALCLKHDVRDRLKVRICGYKDLSQEKQDLKSRQKAIKLLGSFIQHRKDKHLGERSSSYNEPAESAARVSTHSALSQSASDERPAFPALLDPQIALSLDPVAEAAAMDAEMSTLLQNLRNTTMEIDGPVRPLSRGSNSTDPPSRSSSPAHSAQSLPATPEPGSAPRRPTRPTLTFPKWRGCQTSFCPAIRAPGDHRRRCVAAMRQCAECKVHVCGDCVTTLEPPCPCQGCRISTRDDDGASQTNTETILFFCQNCRWDRMQTGKCRRRSEAFLTAQAARRKGKRKERARKPVENRRPVQDAGVTLTITTGQDEAIDGLVDFFAHLNAQLPSSQTHDALPEYDVEGTQGDIQELEDMGVLARDLIRRIQRLREQFQPGSLAAMALPDVRMEEEDTAQDESQDEATLLIPQTGGQSSAPAADMA